MALKSISGTLASADVLEAIGRRPVSIGALRMLLDRSRASLGPASGARQVFDLLLRPLLSGAGLATTILHDDVSAVSASFGAAGFEPSGMAVACGWGGDLR